MGSCVSKERVEPSINNRTTQDVQNKRNKQKIALDNNSRNTEQNEYSTHSSNEIAEKEALNSQMPVQSEAFNESSEERIKILLLGSGESGKSTIVKQMKILHQEGYSDEELYEYKPFVYKNILDCIKNVINAIIDLEPELIRKDPSTEAIDGKDDEEGSNEAIAITNNKPVLDYDTLMKVLDYEINIDSDEPFDTDVAHKILEIYSKPEVKSFIKHQQGKFYLIDSTHYFMTELSRITDVNYKPSVDDILRTRKKTSGIFDFKFKMGGLNIHMYDVGGQRSERKKWIHCFDNVTLIIFCVALSEYDQVLLEDNNQNRLEESLTLFDSVVNSRWFARTSIVLFLNKIDVFADKLPYSPLENQFPDYTGGDNIQKAAKYIVWRFTQVNRSGLNIYPHVTQATDTSNIQLVFGAVKETILENSLKDTGLL